jgi:glycogen phosphorylase
VLATRMVRDYVRELYAPACHNARLLNADYTGAAKLAAWKKKVRTAWPAVRVEHVESSGVGDAVEVGAVLSVRAFVSLGDLAPDDVHVQVLHGKIDSNDVLADVTVRDLVLAETYDGGRYRFDGDVELDRGGPFGYTVRVIPRNELLTSVAELGVVAVA